MLGRFLGPSKGGDEIDQWVLKANSEIFRRRVLSALQVIEMHSHTETKKIDLFDYLAKKRGISSIKPPENAEVKNDEQYYEECQDDTENPRIKPDIG